MAPALKQRLVGAIVLVALAVIFVPMVLDGSGRQGGERVSVEIPEEPQDPDPALEADDASSSTARSTDGSTTTSAADPSGDAEAKAADESAGETTGPDSEPSSPSTEPTASATDEASADEPPDSTVSREQQGSPEESGPTAWVVQVGSFGQKTNAVVLRDKLREADRDAFIEEGETDSGSVWRVRVGPVPTREGAEQVKKRLDSERDTESLVMSYPD